jgi:hypothetical protein
LQAPGLELTPPGLHNLRELGSGGFLAQQVPGQPFLATLLAAT